MADTTMGDTIMASSISHVFDLQKISPRKLTLEEKTQYSLSKDSQELVICSTERYLVTIDWQDVTTKEVRETVFLAHNPQSWTANHYSSNGNDSGKETVFDVQKYKTYSKFLDERDNSPKRK
ncbi:MAG: hypothetical protein WCI72_05095 [archaeon]